MVNISKNYADLITVQEYSQKQSIDEVKLIDLKLHADDGGEFLELGRLDQGMMKTLPEFTAKQVSWSRLLPGTVKAFHVHRRQADLWYVSPFDRVLVGLADLREESPTYNTKVRLVLGGSQAKLLYIPRGVAHGAGNPWSRPATVIYFTDEEFDPAAPDEGRLPYDLFGQEFWQIHKG